MSEGRTARLTRSERAILVTVALGTILAPLNSTVIAVALPDIRSEFGASVALSGWLVVGYLISVAAVQPIAGKLGDRWGRRPVMIGGLITFAAASLGAALAPSLPVLLVFRILQALSGALVVPNGIALVRECLPAHRRGLGFGIVGGAASLAAAVGPPLGGALTAAAGWRSTFYLSLPIVACAVALGMRTIPRITRRAAARFDGTGTVLIFASMGLLGAAIGTAEGTSSTAITVAAACGCVLIAGAAVVHELRHPDPVLELRVFGERAFSAAASSIALSNLAMYVTLLLVPLLLATRPGHESWKTGLVLTALSATSALLAPFGGRLADRLGRRPPATVGLAVMTLALLPPAIDSELSLAALAASLAVAGAGLGLAGAGIQAAAVESVAAERAGAAAGLSSTVRYVGSIAGSIALALLVEDRGSSLAGATPMLVIVVCAAALAALATLGMAHARPSAQAAPDHEARPG